MFSVYCATNTFDIIASPNRFGNHCYNISMMQTRVSSGTVHQLTPDIQKVLLSNTRALAAWQDITPLARNEFICWITDAKRPETRAKRIRVAIDKLSRGERRPCCWIGCTHRTDKPMSPTQKWALDKTRSPKK